MRKNRRKNRAVLSLILAALLAVEPAGAVMTVEASENPVSALQTETGGDDAGDGERTGEDSASSEEDGTAADSGNTEENATGQDSANTESDGTDTGSGNAEEDNGTTDYGNTDGDGTGSGSSNKEEGAGADSDHPDESGEDEESADGDGIENDAEDAEEPEEDSEGEDNTADDEEDVEGTEETEDEETDTDEDERLEGFAQMPSNYRLTSEQMESKRDLASHLDEISAFEEGVDYVDGQVITFAETQEEAEQIAAAYHARIVAFEYGVLTLELGRQDTVSKAMRVAANEEINLPAVWPNYYRYAYEEITADESDLPYVIPEDVSADSEQDTYFGQDGAQEDTAQQDDFIEIATEEYEMEGAADGIDGADQTEPSYMEALAYSDPYLNSADSHYQYHHTIIGSSYAWAAGYTGQGIKVAVLDTGVANHTDVSATSIYGPGTSDSHGHGTHVAGIIGAKANGKLGVGVAPGVTLYSGNVLPNGTGTDDDIIKAIKAAQAKNVDIINMSLGGLGYNGAFQQTVNQAYEQGIALFAASGNDGGANYTYPSCYDHVISVAATDAGNERAYFSNYGNKVDLSAPGVFIWSTSKDGSNYTRMSGTSMACPVAAGEAAVILSGNASVRSKTGKARVNALESTMKANAIKAGSGMGAGITILPKALKLSTAVTKPATPTVSFAPDNKAAAQTVKVTIKAQGEVTVYYTTNGKTPTYKNGLVGNGAVQYTQPFDIKNQAKATVKAIAVNENGVASAVRSSAYALKPYVSSITISGVQQIAKGKSVQMKAEILPAYATNKKVTWELYTADNKKIDAKLAKETGVSITSSGKVTATKNAKLGNYTIKVTAKDNGAKSATYKITVIDTVKIDTVKFMDKSKNTVLKNVELTLSTQPTDSSRNLGESLEWKCKDGAKATLADFKWSSSNAAVAKVDTKGVVTPLKAGKVTITALANDSSGKKATCTITIKKLADKITISGSAKVAAGTSQTYKATVTPDYTSNKKVTWKLSDATGEVTAKRGKEIGVSINSANGRLTTTAKAAAGTYTVSAVAADGSGKSASKSVVVTKGKITGITWDNTAYKKVSIFRKQQVSGTTTSTTVSATVKGTDGADLSAYTVTNSNPGIASVSAKQSGAKITLTIKATGKAAGKTTITIAATDGSGKKLTCTATVNNPASGIVIAPQAGRSQYVAKGKNLQLKAVVETENGKVSNKGVTWELYNSKGTKIDENLSKTNGMKITAGGKVTATSKATIGSYTVKATAKDGSGVYKEYAISVADPATYINLYNSRGYYMSTAYQYIFDQGKLYQAKLTTDAKQGTIQGSIAVSSSNPAVISVSVPVSGTLEIAAYKKGTAVVTLTAMDGSGTQVKYYFAVR
ncbi:MAG: S8 family serine peptidase [Lachnospiraceae bacterium]|nr:S8 family serine peptidase [Lachnospiraceae bacterium]